MKESRHLKALRATVARDFIRASGDAFGRAVAVTHREIILARARVLRRPLLQRYRLKEIASIHSQLGRSVNLLLIEFGGRQPGTLTIMYAPSAVATFQDVIAMIERVSRLRHSAGHLLYGRTRPRSLLAAS